MPAKPITTIVALLAGLFAATQAQAAAARLVFLGTFENPTFVGVAPGEPNLLFVVERPGVVRLLINEQRIATPFLDIRDLVLGQPDAGAGGEQGLLSIAFAPDYAQSQRFYVAFTNNNGSIEIDEFHRRADTRQRADRTTRRILLTIPHAGAQNHNGGQLAFGSDGFLYISTGDGGNLSPPGEPARHLSNLLGKILRINPLPDGAQPYGIPNSNPFVGKAGRDEIFAYGLRNPWRFSFDRQTGDLFLADVGEATREEINFQPAGSGTAANYGWRLTETVPNNINNIVFNSSEYTTDTTLRPKLTVTY